MGFEGIALDAYITLFTFRNLFASLKRSTVPTISNTSPIPDLTAPQVSPSFANPIVFETPLFENAFLIPSTDPTASNAVLTNGLEYN